MTALTWYEPAAVRSRCTRAHEPTSTRVRRNRSASSYLQSLQRPIPTPALPRAAPPFPPRAARRRARYIAASAFVVDCACGRMLRTTCARLESH